MVEAPADCRQMVLAGPGTGKTHALIARIVYLVETANLSPGSEVLILSFSRAAVAEIKGRVASAVGGLAYIRAQTFDSFATRMLSDIDAGGSWMNESYDGRIREATRAINEDSPAQQYAAQFKHVLIDEIQDVLGDRIGLAQALLRTIDGGFTAFGDPAQGIFTFGEKGGSSTPWDLVNWLRAEFGDELLERTFHDNRRCQSAENGVRAALWAGDALLGKDPKYTDGDSIEHSWIYRRLAEVLLDLEPLGGPATAAPRLKARLGSAAILTRTNAEALLISRQLWQLHYAHQLQREAADRVLPSWLAKALGRRDSSSLGHDSFVRMLEISESLGMPLPDDAWRTLKRIERRPGGTLDLDVLHRRIQLGAIPDDLVTRPAADLVVSTIHRAKGREYDVVAVAEDGRRMLASLPSSQAIAESARVMFVALTRARAEVFQLTPPPLSGYLLDQYSDRWIKRLGWLTPEVEIKADDLSRAEPAGLSLGADPRVTQDYIASDVHEGDPVELRRESATDGEPTARFGLYHRDNIVGITDQEFASSMYQALKVNRTWQVRWPQLIDCLFVEGIDTVAGDIGLGRQAKLGNSGLWARVRVVGLGKIHS